MSIRINIGTTFDARDIRKAERELEGLRRELDSTGDKFQNFGRTMSAVGGLMTKAITAPLVGIGITSIKTASDFGLSMSKIVGLVGIAADEVKGMEGAVLGLSGETAKSPQELADALFVVTSAGLRGAEAMDALEAAAKASAAGLGQTSDIARAVSGVLNAYGSSVGSAANVTDVLVATARAGNFETSQFAAALGRVLPFASQAGASIEDVGGAVALLTRTNGNAAESITQITALLGSFVTPTRQARTVLAEYGLTAGDLRDQLAKDGLVATLQTLDKALGGNREELGRLLSSQQAASAAFQILNASGEDVASTFGVVNEAVGLTDDAFRNVSEQAAFKFQQALADLSVLAIDLGNALIPTVIQILDKFKDLVDRFNGLEDAQKKNVLQAGLFAAALGPIIIVAGNLITVVGGLISAFALLGVTAGPVLLGIAALAGIAFLAVKPFNKELSETARLQADAFNRNDFRVPQTLQEFGDELNRNRRAQEQFNELEVERFARMRDSHAASKDLTDVTDETTDAIDKQVDALGAVAKAAGGSGAAGPTIVKLTGSMRELLQSLNKTQVGTGDAGDSIAQFSRELLAAGSITDETAQAATRLAAVVRGQLDKALADGNRRLGEAKQKFDSFRDSIASGITSGNQLSDAVSGQTSAIEELTRAEERLEEAQASGDDERIAEAQKDLAEAKKQQKSFLSFLQTGADTAEGFAQQIDSLRLAGASLEVVQQIAQLGAKTGGRVIAELMSGGAEAIAQANRLVAAVEEASQRAGIAAADQFFGAGVRSAQRFIDAVEASIPELQSVLDTIADMIEKALGVRPKVDITGRTTFIEPPAPKPTPSPAPRFTMPVDRFGSEEFNLGTAIKPTPNPFLSAAQLQRLQMLDNLAVMGTGGIVTSPTLALIGEAGPEAVIPLSRGGDMGGGDNINITVTSADPQAVVEALRRYTRANGPLGTVVNV